ncbi:unnamed protein product [Closterium sp. Yama58-4]|nr:unnamed protein product [Closterium sp. Yama58-4]
MFASKLRHVAIDSLKSSGSLELLSHLTSLERLDVEHVRENEPFPVGLFSLPSLAFVKLGDVKWMEGTDVMPLWQSACPNSQSPTAIYNAALEIAAAESNTTYPPLGRSLRHLDISVGELDGSERRFMSAGLCSFEWLTHLTISNLHSSGLLPIALGQLRNLRSLSLSGRVQFFPPSLALLASSLQSLTLISSLLPAFCQFSRLHTLTIIKYDDLISLPANFGAMVSLKSLSIRECKVFRHLPDSLSTLRSLLHLTIKDCPRFSSLPDGFGLLPGLTQLEISRCVSFTRLPASFPSLPLLRVACFSHCKWLHSLPPHMGQMLRLEELQLPTAIRVGHVPPVEKVTTAKKELALALSAPAHSALSLFRNLSLTPSITSVSLAERALDFYDDAFLSSLIYNCARLVRLRVHEPCFAGSPHFQITLQSLEEFFRLAAPRLQELTLSHCLGQMENLPGSIASMSSLRVLRLHSKFLRTLPDGICQLSALQELHLSCPLLWQLPEAFGELRSLAQLSFSECTKLQMLPDSFNDLSSLTSLRIDGSWQVHPFSTRMGALQNLRRLELRKFDGRLPLMYGRWTKLEVVTLESCPNIFGFPTSCSGSLTALTIRSCPSVRPRLDRIFASQLRHVTIDSLNTSVSLESLSHLSSLERLDVAFAGGDESFPVGLFALPSLTFVKLGNVRWMEGGDLDWDWFLEGEGDFHSAAEKAAAAIAARGATYPPLGRSLRHLDIRLRQWQRTCLFPTSERRFMSAWLCSLEWLTHLTVSNLDDCTLLPAALGHLRSLRSLSLSGRFQYFPPSVALLASTLESLTLHFSRESCRERHDQACPTLQATVAQLTSLTYLDLTNIGLRSDKPGLARLALLRTLRVDYKPAGEFIAHVDLPENMGCLGKLEILELPPSVCELPSLEKLHVKCECLEQLPANIFKLTRLEELTIECCYHMKTLPACFGFLEALKKLSIEGTKSPSFLDPLCGLPSLEEATLICGSNISSLPPAFCQFSRLHSLTIISYDALTSLPANFGTLVSLKKLSIVKCQVFHHLPDSFSALASLVHLTITDCPTFSSLPHGFGSLPRLTQLEISRCDFLTHLPFSFPSLPSLRVACFSHCKQLHSLPAHMGQMLRLEVLQLRGCVALKALPNSLKVARALRSVDVVGSGLDQEGGEVNVCRSRVFVVRRKLNQIGK